MDSQYERKLNRAKELIEQIKNGTDPINNVKLPDDNFLRDEKMQNLLGFIDDVLTNEIYSLLPKIDFYITPDEIKSLDVIGGDITVTDFADYINNSIFLRNKKNSDPHILTPYYVK